MNENGSPSTHRSPLSNAALSGVLDIWGQKGQQNLLPIAGTSMWPFLQAGDRVHVHHGNRGVRWGEVIVFRQQETLIVHRLVFRRRQDSRIRYIMLGDNRLSPDPAVMAQEIVGRVTAIHRGERVIDLTRGRWWLYSQVLASLGFFWLGWLLLMRGLQRVLPVWGRRPLNVLQRLAQRFLTVTRRGLMWQWGRPPVAD